MGEHVRIEGGHFVSIDAAGWVAQRTGAEHTELTSALRVPDLDQPNKRARVVSKGGKTEWVFWQTGAAMLLPRLGLPVVSSAKATISQVGPDGRALGVSG